MGLRTMDPKELQVNPFTVFDDDWALLTVGTEDRLNTMTISWGGLGTFWGRAVATVYVGLGRCTKELMDACDTFSVTWLPREHRADLGWLGSHHARDFGWDKVSHTHLTPLMVDGTPTFEEAELVLVCRKAYADLMPREGFVDPQAESTWYSEADDAVEDWHTLYIGYVEQVLVRDEAS